MQGWVQERVAENGKLMGAGHGRSLLLLLLPPPLLLFLPLLLWLLYQGRHVGAPSLRLLKGDWMAGAMAAGHAWPPRCLLAEPLVGPNMCQQGTLLLLRPLHAWTDCLGELWVLLRGAGPKLGCRAQARPRACMLQQLTCGCQRSYWRVVVRAGLALMGHQQTRTWGAGPPVCCRPLVLHSRPLHRPRQQSLSIAHVAPVWAANAHPRQPLPQQGARHLCRQAQGCP